jgi:cell division protein FtsL
MIRMLNIALLACVLLAAFKVYSIEYAKRSVRRDIERAEVQIAEQKDLMKLLTAEWSSLQRPERLATLARQHLKLKPVSQIQFSSPRELVNRLPERSAAFEASRKDDPVGALIEEFAQ